MFFFILVWIYWCCAAGGRLIQDPANTVTVVHGLVDAVNINTACFSADALLACHGLATIETRVQARESREYSVSSWAYHSKPDSMRMCDYIRYQDMLEPRAGNEYCDPFLVPGEHAFFFFAYAFSYPFFSTES